MEIKSDIINCAFKARAERAQQHRSGERGFAFKPIRRTNLIKTSLPFKKLANTFPTIIVIAVNYLIEKFPRLSREEKKKREDDVWLYAFERRRIGQWKTKARFARYDTMNES